MRAQPPWYVEVLPPFAILVAPLLLPSPSNLPFPVFPLLFHTTAATESDARDHAAPAAPPRSPPPAAPTQAPPGAPPRLRAGNRKTGRVRCAASPRPQSCGRPRAPSRVACTNMEGGSCSRPVRRTGKAAAFREVGDGVRMDGGQGTGRSRGERGVVRRTRRRAGGQPPTPDWAQGRTRWSGLGRGEEDGTREGRRSGSWKQCGFDGTKK